MSENKFTTHANSKTHIGLKPVQNQKEKIRIIYQN